MSDKLLQLIGLVTVVLGTASTIGGLLCYAINRLFRAKIDLVAYVNMKREYEMLHRMNAEEKADAAALKVSKP